MRSAVESPALRQGRMSICAYSLTAEVRPCVIRTSPDGQVAQLVEQRTENPRVGGSIPSLATISKGSIPVTPKTAMLTSSDRQFASRTIMTLGRSTSM
jgi:hypothetical protein